MRIAFVFAPYLHKKFEEDVDVVSREFGTFPPLGLGFAAAIADKAGHETMIVDAHAEALSPRQVYARIRPFKPDLLGFMLTTYMFHDTMKYITALKERTGLPVVVGNIQMELYPEETLSYPAIDYGIIGSAQQALPELLAALEAGREAPDVPGLCHRGRNGDPVIRLPDTLRENFDTLPFPKREGLPHHIYHAVMSRKRNLTSMITAKGCPGGCTFCHIHATPYSARAPDAVIDEMELCQRRYGINEFEIFDPSFTINRKRVIALCDEIEGRRLKLDYAVRARVDQVDAELLNRMARSGCRRILYGIESGSQQQLEVMQKGITMEQVRQAVGDARRAGIEALGFFLIGSQGETLQTVDETVRFARELGLDYAQFHRTMPKPHTVLNEIVTEFLGYDYWREYTLGNQPEIRLPSPWTELTQAEIERAAYRAYRQFYMHPRVLARHVLSIRSPQMFMRYLRSGLGLLFGRSDLK